MVIFFKRPCINEVNVVSPEIRSRSVLDSYCKNVYLMKKLKTHTFCSR